MHRCHLYLSRSVLEYFWNASENSRDNAASGNLHHLIRYVVTCQCLSDLTCPTSCSASLSIEKSAPLIPYIIIIFTMITSERIPVGHVTWNKSGVALSELCIQLCFAFFSTGLVQVDQCHLGNKALCRISLWRIPSFYSLFLIHSVTFYHSFKNGREELQPPPNACLPFLELLGKQYSLKHYQTHVFTVSFPFFSLL